MIKTASAWWIGLAAAAGGLAGVASAQSAEGRPAAREALEPKLVRSRSLIGAGVRLEPDPSAGEPAADGEAGAPGADTVGSIVDLIVDTASGRVFLAVARKGSSPSRSMRTVVPLNVGRWDTDSKQYVLRLSRAQLEVLPRIQASWFGGAVPREDERATPALAKRVRAPGKKRRRTRELATRLSLRPVRAQDGRVGVGSGLIVELESGTVAFLSVVPTSRAARGLTYFVPWQALRCVGARHDRSPCIQLAVDRERLARAPRGVGDGMSDLRKPEMRRKIYAFYGVELPAFDQVADGKR